MLKYAKVDNVFGNSGEYMSFDFQPFIKTCLTTALTARIAHPGSEHLEQAFAARDAMARLLGQVAVAHYREHAARYLELRVSYKV